MADGGDGGQRAYWNGPATRDWAIQHERLDARLALYADLLLEAAAPRPGERVLDVGCGAGATVLALAERVGPGGSVLGVDIAEASVAVAQRRVTEAALPQARVELADAATSPFPDGAFDLIASRFGVMFFEDPVPAFANLRRALAPSGRATFVAWRTPAENPWATAPVAAVRHLLPPLPPPPGPEEPGQFAFGDGARVRRLLEGAGFRDVALSPRDVPVTLGADAAGATEGAMTFGPVHRALLVADDAQREAVRAALLESFRARDASGADGLVLPSAVWVITARR